MFALQVEDAMLMFDKTTNRHRGKKPHERKQPLRPLPAPSLLTPSPTDKSHSDCSKIRQLEVTSVGGLC